MQKYIPLDTYYFQQVESYNVTLANFCNGNNHIKVSARVPCYESSGLPFFVLLSSYTDSSSDNEKPSSSASKNENVNQIKYEQFTNDHQQQKGP